MSVNSICVIIGASHAGVNLAFSLRREGWEGAIMLFDSDPETPYHRPPLSKAYLSLEDDTQLDLLFPKQNYESENITLCLRELVIDIDKITKSITL